MFARNTYTRTYAPTRTHTLKHGDASLVTAAFPAPWHRCMP